MNAQASLEEKGGETIIPTEREGESPAMLRPGMIDVSGIVDRSDEEIFGPLLQVIRVPSFEAALAEAAGSRPSRDSVQPRAGHRPQGNAYASSASRSSRPRSTARMR